MNKTIIDSKEMDKYNIEVFETNGYNCRIREFSKDYADGGTYLCGYIEIPEDSSLYGYEYDDIDIECTREINYSEFETNGYWIGFDCFMIENDHEPLSKEFVKNELNNIANQIIEIDKNITNEQVR